MLLSTHRRPRWRPRRGAAEDEPELLLAAVDVAACASADIRATDTSTPAITTISAFAAITQRSALRGAVRAAGTRRTRRR
ncbi:hypothetical protein ACU686_09300 [Yinghuangia aomiensis]